MTNNIDRLNSGAVKLRQRKLLGSLFEEYPPSGRRVNQPQRISRNDAMKTVDDQDNQPCDQREYLHFLTRSPLIMPIYRVANSAMVG